MNSISGFEVKDLLNNYYNRELNRFYLTIESFESFSNLNYNYQYACLTVNKIAIFKPIKVDINLYSLSTTRNIGDSTVYQ